MDFFDIRWQTLIAPVATLLIGFIAYQLLRKFFNARIKHSNNALLQRQITNFIFMLFLVIAFVLALPIKESMQGQIIGLIGILLSASIALSSTTFLGNLMAGIWLRSVKNFRVGDLVEVKEHFGRISARGLLHIEIQNRERDLVTVPNMYLVANPVTVMHNDGTIISTEISLGYDIDHSIIEPLLIKASEKSGLENSFVYIESLGDYSIVYKVHGLVKEINSMLSARSKLNACILDAMHKAKIEIVSPSFMNQRQVNEQSFVPKQRVQKDESAVSPEDVIFDKAEKAERLDDMRRKGLDLSNQISELKEQIKEATDFEKKQQLKQQLERLESREDRMQEYVKAKAKEVSKEGKDD